MDQAFWNATEKLQQQAFEMEQAVIGCCLMGTKEQISEVRENLQRQHFFFETLATVYETICRMQDRREHIDVITVERDLDNHGMLDFVGGRPSVMACLSVPPAVSKGPYYANYIIEAWRKRQLYRLGGEIRELSHEAEPSGLEQAARWEMELRKLATSGKNPELKGLSQMLAEGYNEIANSECKVGISGIGTGFERLDNVTQGWQKGDLVVVAGRPGSGKTSIALQTSVNAARQGMSTLFFSIEMTEEKVRERILSFCSGVNLYNIIGRNLTDYHHESLVKTVADHKDTLKFNYDRVTTGSIRATSHRFKRDHGLNMILVDYLQIISSDYDRPDLRRLEVANIAKELKFLAKELNIPVIVLCQASREVDKRDDKRPQLSDLAESGHIEYEADLVMFTQIMHKKDPMEEMQHQEKDCKDAFLYIEKHRNGDTGSIPMKFVPRIAAFKSVEERQ